MENVPTRYKYIESNPKVLGGAWVIKGTRVLLERIGALMKKGKTISEISKDYPHVSYVQMVHAYAEYFYEILQLEDKEE